MPRSTLPPGPCTTATPIRALCPICVLLRSSSANGRRNILRSTAGGNGLCWNHAADLEDCRADSQVQGTPTPSRPRH